MGGNNFEQKTVLHELKHIESSRAEWISTSLGWYKHPNSQVA